MAGSYTFFYLICQNGGSASHLVYRFLLINWIHELKNHEMCFSGELPLKNPVAFQSYKYQFIWLFKWMWHAHLYAYSTLPS